MPEEKKKPGAPPGRVRGATSCPCPTCGGRSRVRQTYHPDNYGQVIRRRWCDACEKYFYTKERVTK